jgi:hypothetical protein
VAGVQAPWGQPYARVGLSPATTATDIRTVIGMTQAMAKRSRCFTAVVAVAAALGTMLTACAGDPEEPREASSPATAPSPDAEPYFTEPFDDDANGWGVIDHPEYGTTAYENGDYVWALTGRIGHLAPEALIEPLDAGELTLADVVVDASATIESGDGVAGVFCRETPDTDADFQWYEFVVRDGYTAIRLADLESNIEVLAEDEGLALPKGEEFRLTASCVGETLTMAVDGRVVLEATDATLADGGVGVEAFTFPLHSEMRMRWHDFSLSKV